MIPLKHKARQKGNLEKSKAQEEFNASFLEEINVSRKQRPVLQPQEAEFCPQPHKLIWCPRREQ